MQHKRLDGNLVPHKGCEGTLTSVLSMTQINFKPGENTNPLSTRAQRDEEKPPMEVTEERLGMNSSTFMPKIYHQARGNVNLSYT